MPYQDHGMMVCIGVNVLMVVIQDHGSMNGFWLGIPFLVVGQEEGYISREGSEIFWIIERS
jgi:hypothetical protein